LPDQDLSGSDTLKLVRYKIVFVKRDHELVFLEKEELVSYETTGPAWAAMKISEFTGSLGTRQPSEYVPECDHKYLRIVFEVLQRWPREPATTTKQLG
jgi:hypothetical protein